MEQLYQDSHLTSLIIQNQGEHGWPARAHFNHGPRLDLPENFGDYISKIFVEANAVGDNFFTPENVYAIHLSANDHGQKEISIIGRL